MRITEGQLRQLIREELLREVTLGQLWDRDPSMRLRRPAGPRGSFEDLASGPGSLQYEDDPDSPEGRARNKYRRALKQQWNKHADMSFFQDPKNLTPIHFLGLYSGKSALSDYFPADVVEREMRTSNPRIPGVHVPNRNELSCEGIMRPYTSDQMADRAGLPFFKFRKYRVTYASMSDAGTERLSRATARHKSFYAGSGLPKRPEVGTDPTQVPLDRDDDLPEIIEEIVIDNWIVDTYYGPASDWELAHRIGLKFVSLTG